MFDCFITVNGTCTINIHHIVAYDEVDNFHGNKGVKIYLDTERNDFVFVNGATTGDIARKIYDSQVLHVRCIEAKKGADY